jgi:hypothetical protein
MDTSDAPVVGLQFDRVQAASSASPQHITKTTTARAAEETRELSLFIRIMSSAFLEAAIAVRDESKARL